MLHGLRMAWFFGWFLLALSPGSLLFAQDVCGDLRNSYGPFDFRTEKDKLEIVEGAHFLPFVENLMRGSTAQAPGGDIDYTLRASPNHHRALLAMMNLGLRDKAEKPKGSRYTVDCWLIRAERYANDDAMVKVLRGIYLMRKGRHAEAVGKMEEAAALDEGNANIYYNLGLAYYELKDYGKALSNAHHAYQLGFQLPGLRNMLEKVGKWREPKEIKTGSP